MPRMLDASFSANQTPFSDQCAGCMIYQLNTVMKLVAESSLLRSTMIPESFEHIKKAIKTFRHAGFNSKPLHASESKQESPARFGRKYNFVERFVLFSSEMLNTVKECNSEASKKKSFLSELVNRKGDTTSWVRPDGSESFPVLSTLVNIFPPICHAQTLGILLYKYLP